MQYRDLNTYLKETFHQKVYKISLSMPFSCPNRDGTKGVGGCIFCSSSGSGNFASPAHLPIEQQVEEAKKRVAKKLKTQKKVGYIAYFQSFSSTYGDISIQRECFARAMLDPEVVALSVATRPDCLSGEVLDLLEELSRKKPVWVELGLQTSKEETGKLIHRCYDNKDFSDAVFALAKRGILVVAHLIVGLPGEDHQDEIESVRFVFRHPVSGVKFHLLHVLRGTRLSEMEYEVLTREEYVDRVTDLIRYVPKDAVIHRLTGDGDKKELIAPLWSRDKKRVMQAIFDAIREKNIVQGEALEENCECFVNLKKSS